MYNHGDATRLLIKPNLKCRLFAALEVPRTKLCPSLCVGLEGNSASHQHACGPVCRKVWETTRASVRKTLAKWSRGDVADVFRLRRGVYPGFDGENMDQA